MMLHDSIPEGGEGGLPPTGRARSADVRHPPAPSAAHRDSLLFAPSTVRSSGRGSPSASPAGGSPPPSGWQPLHPAQPLPLRAPPPPNPFGPALATPPNPFGPAPTAPTNPFGQACAAPPASPFGQPPNPFAQAGYDDWDRMGGPKVFEGDGFDSDTTAFTSQATRMPFKRGGCGLFATDDQVLPPSCAR